jgi:3-methyladenine DNA glycosylase AlkD
VIGKTDFAQKLIENYSTENKEFVKRTAFVLMCTLAVHDKKLPNELFISYLDIIEREAWDERNFVRKAVNWALRQIGKRNPVLRESAIETGERIKAQGTKSAKWIAGDALRELHDGKIIARINSKVK